MGYILLCLTKGLKQKRFRRMAMKERNGELRFLKITCENCELKNAPDKL